MKFKELTDMSTQELQEKLDDLIETYFNLRFQKSKNMLENPYRFRGVRKDIARIKTLLTQRKHQEQKAETPA